MTPERHHHLPEPPPRPEGLSPEAARQLEQVVREAVVAAIRLATPDGGGARVVTGPPREPYAPDRAGPEGYQVPGFDGEGRPVALPVRGTSTGVRTGGRAGWPVGGLGPGSRSGSGALNLGGRAGRQRPDPSAVGSAASMAALAAVRDRMGPDFRAAPLGRITVNTLYFGETSAHLMPAAGGGAPPGPATVSARLGPGTFYLQPVPRERLGILAVTAPGAAYAVQRVAADGGRQDTGTLVLTRDVEPVRAGIVAYTTDIGAAPPPAPAPAGRKPGDPKQAVALIVAALPHLGPTAPASVATGLLTAYLRDLDHDGLMAALEELRRLGHLGTVLAWARAREFRRFLSERGVPRAYVLKHSVLDAADVAALVGGIVWGAGESYYQIVEIIGILAGSAASERLAQERHQLWQGIVLFVENPLVTGVLGVSLLVATMMEKFEEREFFDLGRIVGQIVVFVWTTWQALKSLPAVARRVVQVSVTVTRIGVAALEEIGLSFFKVLRFTVSRKRVLNAPGGITLMAVGEDIAISSPKVKGTSSLARDEIVKALGTDKAPLTDAELDEVFRMLTDAEKKAATAPEPEAGAAAAAGATTVTPQNLEPLVVQALTKVEGMPGSAAFSPRVRGTHMHKALSDLVKERFPAAVFEVFSEQPLRTFTKLPRSLLDTPIETFVANTPEVADYASNLKSLFRSKESGAVRLLGDLEPDLVTRGPNGLIVWDLVPVQRQDHLAKTLLYRAILRRGGESVEAAEVYYSHFGKSAEEIGKLPAYQSAVRRAAKQRAIAKAIAESHGLGRSQ
ncbi:hypothetical protein DMB38_13215 [Streptomyces sp. WAC 06738]|uniref:hypothetical protein n=1 Tax=Streptomyces sp. WAC 06738 TaxID=2203210 RepID=UPI000F6EB79D|nr:hypothetical protein [Streptomyces sp. WAC 06738]AZM46639.1 hypothetical protein DMB38_13215 [Streptomyces sp. WAC 06738]